MHTWPAGDAGHVDLIVKVTDVADDGVVLHLGQVVRHDDVLVAGGGHKNVNRLEDILQGRHAVALHGGLQRADGVDLRDGHTRPCTATAPPRVTPQDQSPGSPPTRPNAVHQASAHPPSAHIEVVHNKGCCAHSSGAHVA